MGFFGKDSWTDENGGNLPETLSADKVIENDTKQFISKVEKDQIKLNKTALLSKVDSSEVGVPNGVAKLNAQGMVVNSDGTLPSGGSGSVEWGDF